MAKQSEHGIAWTQQTWNPIRGCSRVSEGCRNCYAERVAARFSGPGQPYEGLARMVTIKPATLGVSGTPLKTEAWWTGKVRLVKEHLMDPMRWRKPRMVFVNSMSDLFHEGVSDEWFMRILQVMNTAEHHIFQVLTKRPERMRNSLKAVLNGGGGIAKNIWWGVSVEDQKTADERIPILLDTPAAIRWVSYEPALGPVDFEPFLRCNCGVDPKNDQFAPPWSHAEACPYRARLHWIVVGGESGPHARPMLWGWASQLRRQCQEAGVPFFMKQLSQVAGPGYKIFESFPEEVRVREYPKTQEQEKK